MTSSQQTPSITVVIPSYERPRQLRRCLEALAKSDCARSHFEVVVVDDGSRVSLNEAVREFAAVMDVRLIRQSNQGAAAARNTGVAHARGRFLAFVDDDCCPSTTWLSTISQRLSEDSERIVGGHVSNTLVSHPLPTASQLLVDYLYFYYNNRMRPARFFASNNLACSVDSFHKVGGFDSRFRRAGAEDRDICDRWASLGHELKEFPDMVVCHEHALNLAGFVKQHFNYGRGSCLFHAFKKKREPRHKLPQLRFYLDLLLFPYSRKCAGAPVLTVLLAISQIATACGYFYQKGCQKLSASKRAVLFDQTRAIGRSSASVQVG